MLHFYGGAVTRADYWGMPQDERRAMIEYMQAVIRERNTHVG